MKKTILSIVAVALLSCGFTCTSRTLIQEVAAAAASVAVVADPAISNYVQLAQDGVNCATAPGTTTQVIDGCLATALQNYQLALPHASPRVQALIQVVIIAIEGIINDNAGGQAQGQVMAKAKAQVHNPAAHAPTAKAFKQQYNAAAKIAGAKAI